MHINHSIYLNHQIDSPITPQTYSITNTINILKSQKNINMDNFTRSDIPLTLLPNFTTISHDDLNSSDSKENEDIYNSDRLLFNSLNSVLIYALNYDFV